MNEYFLIGAYSEEGREDEAKCIDVINNKNCIRTYDDTAKYIWKYQRENLEKFDILFIVSNELKIFARVSSFTNIDYMRMAIENDRDLKEYYPVYVDIAEHDERVLLSNILGIDLV